MIYHELKKAKLWTPIESVEESALEQIKLTMLHPRLFKHLAVMPDVHAGIGCTIGSVIPVKDAIIPASVGVDIGCFTGETTVPCLDGKEHSLKELADGKKSCWIYSVSSEGEITVAQATAKRTRESAQFIRVHLDNGEYIDCTPDHQFRLRHGEYKKAESLTPDDSLTPLYKRVDKDGYLRVKLLKKNWGKRVHWMVAHAGALGKLPSVTPQKLLIHHKDFDKENNSPSNLRAMGNSDHSKLHAKIAMDRNNSHWQSPEFERRRLEGIQRSKEDPEARAKRAQVGTENFRRYMEDNPEHFKESVRGNGERGGKYLSAYNKSAKGRAKSKEIANLMYTCDICGKTGKSPIFLHNHRKKEHGYNHRVVRIEQLTITAPAYCLTVPEHHNFALSAGVFVHNCGMCAVKTDIKLDILEPYFDALYGGITSRIPVGFAHRVESQMSDYGLFTLRSPKVEETIAIYQKLYPDKAIAPQMGTLGGGNHFIELQVDPEGYIWIMLHSGSRNIGNRIATFFINQAKQTQHKYSSASETVPANMEYLPYASEDGQKYLIDMEFALNFAMQNRRLMMDIIQDEILKCVGSCNFDEPINIHHNYAAKETHFGEEVWVHRKGATKAVSTQLGIIPGSMGSASYIVRGKDNVDSFTSCAHGAGRTMSRTAARGRFHRKTGKYKTEGKLNVADFESDMQGIFTKSVDRDHLDEAPRAYKNISEVMKHQTDLIDIVVELKPVFNIKG